MQTISGKRERHETPSEKSKRFCFSNIKICLNDTRINKVSGNFDSFENIVSMAPETWVNYRRLI